MYYYVLGNALVLVVFLDTALGRVPFRHDAHAPGYLSGYAIASATAAKEICCWRDHERGARRTADQTTAGCKGEVGTTPWVQK